jgi:hypothetical protein
MKSTFWYGMDKIGPKKAWLRSKSLPLLGKQALAAQRTSASSSNFQILLKKSSLEATVSN